MNRTSVLVLSAALASLLIPARTSGWPVHLNGTENENDYGNDVVLDSAGDVVAVGTLDNADTGQDFTVVKFSGATGGEIWRREITGASPLYDQAMGVALDPQGNIVVAGYTGGALRNLTDMTVVKLDPTTGADIWRNDVTTTGSASYDTARGVGVDHAGNVIAVGNLEPEPSGFDPDYAAVKLSGVDGSELWRAVVGGSAKSGDYAYRVVADPFDDVITAGYFQNTPNLLDGLLVKFAGATGAESWRWVVHGTDTGSTGYNIVNGIAADAAGNVFGAGFISNIGTGSDFVVAKLARADGHELWRREINNVQFGYDGASAIAVDAAGEPVASGVTYDGTDYRFTVIKFSGATGDELWRHTVPGTPGGCCIDSAYRVAVDGDGNVVAAGSVDQTLTLVKLAGATGDELWRQALRNTVSDGYGFPYAVSVNAAGDVAAVGYSYGGDDSENDFTVVKVLGATGAISGCGNGTLDPGEQCDDGNAVSGDGCDPDCLNESALPTCGDGVPQAGEQCDDGNAVSGDGCEPDCTVTVPVVICAGGTTINRPRISLKKLSGASGDESLRFSGQLVFAPGTPAQFDPVRDGAQVLIEDLGSGARAVFDLTLRTQPIPGSAQGVCNTSRDGWRRLGRVQSYRNGSGSIDPPACNAGSAQGLRRIMFFDRRTSRGVIYFAVKIRNSSIAPPLGPLRGTIVLGAGEAASTGGACGTHAFAAASCSTGSSAMSCK